VIGQCVDESVQLGGDLRDVAALIARAFQLDRRGLAASVAARNCGSTIR